MSNERAGLVAGGSLRYLRYEYTHDDFAGERARGGEVSIEAIIGFKWHLGGFGFYLQPWLGISRGLFDNGSSTVGDRDYEQPILSPFATVNLGWELEL